MSDWMSICDDREKYRAYLCSREWAVLRNAVRDRCGGVCERCGTNAMECVHHLTYARKYKERTEDLAGWCHACHDFTHGRTNEDPLEARESNVFVDTVLSLRKSGVSWNELKRRIISGGIGGAKLDPFGLILRADVPGLAKDFLEAATGASWRGETLVLEMPAGVAASFLMRTDVRARVRNALTTAAGRHVDYVVECKP